MPYTDRPSDRVNAKTRDPFSKSNSSISSGGRSGGSGCGGKSSSFVTVYANGGIPCRLNHGSVKHTLVWQQDPATLPYDPLLVTVVDGLTETDHPYAFVARTAFVEMMKVDGAEAKTVPLTRRLILPLKSALAHSDAGVFQAALECLIELSATIGPNLNPFIGALISPLSKRNMDPVHRERVFEALQQIEGNGGPDCLSTIKAKIPTYTSINM